MSDLLVPAALRRRHAQTVKDSTSSYKMNYVIEIKNFQNSEGHQNIVSCVKVTAILLKGWILSIDEVALGRICACNLRSRLIYYFLYLKSDQKYVSTITEITESSL